jgi:alkaline phosphatase
MALGMAYAAMVAQRELHFGSLMADGNTGYSLPLPFESSVTDSAAAATQMATGRLARNESIGMAPDGEPMETILEWAEGRGLATGLVTNMRLSHATPAAFASHHISRYNPEPAILDEMLLDHNVDVLLGGGARALVPESRSVREFLPGIPEELDGRSNRSDERNVLVEAEERGYRIVSQASELTGLGSLGPSGKLLGLFSATHLPYVLDRELFDLDTVPKLRDMTEAALSVLSQTERGFFLLVEAGRIDYAGHDNDAGAMLHEVLETDEAIGVALEFQARNPDTLVIVTADHGTGGFTFTYGDFGRPEELELPTGLVYAPHHYYPTREHLLRLYNQKASYAAIVSLLDDGGPDELIELVKEHTGLEMTMDEARTALVRDEDGNARTVDFRDFYGDVESNPMCLLGRALARHTHVVWSTGGHTTEPVLTFGRGPGAERLRGVYRNTFVHEVMKDELEAATSGAGRASALSADAARGRR